MLPVEMKDNVRDHLDAPDNFWSDEIIWRRMQEAQGELIRDISKEDPSYFVETYDITFVADQATYDLPTNAGLGTRVIFGENSIDGSGGELPPARLRDLLSSTQPSVVNLSETYHFTLEGAKIRVIPTPSVGKVAAVRIWFVPIYGHMMQGVASAGSTTTLTFSTADVNWTTNWGWKDTRNDYFNGMHVHIYEGAGVGDVRKISDYTGGSTFRITVDTAFSAAIDTTSKYAILCPARRASPCGLLTSCVACFDKRPNQTARTQSRLLRPPRSAWSIERTVIMDKQTAGCQDRNSYP